MHSNTEHKGIFNFENLFNACSCIGRKKEEESISSARTIEKLNPQRYPDKYEEIYSSSNDEWVSLGEISFNQGNFGDNNDDKFGNIEYETLEPIDFEYLKQITDDPKNPAEKEKSQASGLSKSSKKIKKNPAQKKERVTKNASPSNSPKKADKGGEKKFKRNPWQPHEDARLLELVAKHGQSWSLLSTMIEGRTGKQIRDRYLNILRPNIKKGDWTPQEDQHILALYYQYGHKWSKISSFVPGRTEGQVKNRFYSHIKKKILGKEGEQISIDVEGQEAFNSNQSPSTHSGLQFPSTATSTYSNQVYNGPPGVKDASELISYQDDGRHVNRHGSNEVFFEQPLASPSSDHLTNFSSQSMTVKSEQDIDLVLDKMAIFFDKGNTEIPMQEGMYKTSSHEGDAVDKLERLGQLNKRRAVLEFLLAKTKNELNF